MAIVPPQPPIRQDQGEVLLTLQGGNAESDSSNSGSTFHFPIPPENVSIDQPARVSTTQTLKGAYQDHFGAGVAHVSLRGTTGWRANGTNSQQDGYAAFIALRTMHENYMQRCGAGDPASVTLMLSIAVPQGFGNYRISSDQFRTEKSAQAPLLYRYELQATILEVNAGDLGGLPLTAGGLSISPAALQAQADQAFFNQAQAAYTDLLRVAPIVAIPYVIQSSDSFQRISQLWFGTPQYAPRIRRANALLNIPAPGAVIQIPMEPL